MESEQGIPKEIEEAMRETLKIFVSAEWIEAAMFHVRKPLKEAIAEPESRHKQEMGRLTQPSPCDKPGHFAINCIGDEYGHFSCGICIEMAKLESSATARAFASAAEVVHKGTSTCDLDQDCDYCDLKAKLHREILALTPREARLREEIRRAEILFGEDKECHDEAAYIGHHADTCLAETDPEYAAMLCKRLHRRNAELSILQAELAGIEKK